MTEQSGFAKEEVVGEERPADSGEKTRQDMLSNLIGGSTATDRGKPPRGSFADAWRK